ncbi:MAG TPA: EAL domain-containing protein [Geminicoccaceae bacterium]|nr:EAL domain-containing protein [Geminicoccus sp.]HMU50604.1 EAL domain-containing protein [Geminicoccaceae bacterium]
MSELPPLEPLLDLTGDAVVVLRRPDAARPTADIAWVNRSLVEMVRSKPGQIVGRSLRILRGGGAMDGFMRLSGAVAIGEVFDGRLAFAALDGDEVVADVRGAPFPGSDAYYVLFIQRGGSGVPGLADHAGHVAALASGSLYTLRVGADCRLELEWVDPSIRTLLGYDTEELRLAGGFFDLVADPDLEAVGRRNQAVIAGRQASVDYRIRCSDGRLRRMRDVARPERAVGTGPIGRIVGILLPLGPDPASGIGDGPAERLAGVLASGLHALVALLDVGGHILWVSPEPDTPFAQTIRRGVDQELSMVLGPREQDLWLDRIEHCLSTQTRSSFGFTWSDGDEAQALDIVLLPLGGDQVMALVRPPGVPATTAAAPAAPVTDFAMPQLLDAFEGVSVVLSPELRLMATGTAFERLVGAKAGELHNQPFADLLVPEADSSRLDLALASAARGERTGIVDATLRGRGDHLSPLQWRFTPMLDGRGQCAAILARGTATPRRAGAGSERPRRGEPWLGAILDSVADGIVSIAGDGTIESFSRSAEQIFGFGRGEVQGRHVELLLTAGPSAELNVLKLLTERVGEEMPPLELFARRRSGEVIPVEIVVTPLDYDGQRVFILTIRDITVRKQTEETLRNLAYLDPLTGLPNRLLFHDRLVQAMERARRSHQILAVLLVDLDRFKLINDSLGLEKGDQVLRAVAERLGRTLRRSDTVARLGGDEFMLLVASAANAEAAGKVAQKVLDTLRPPFNVNGHELTTSASIGIALFPHDGDDADTLIKNADTALSRAKEQGRNHFQFYTNDMNAMAFERLMLESRLRKALEQGELVLYYQPQVSLQTGRIVGVEALVRWFHPDLGMVPPAEFIPLAEETGLIVPIGEWVLRTACRDGRRWQELGFKPLRVAVNLSARQFQQRDLVDVVARVLDETLLPATDLELELTESVIMRDAAESVRRLRELTALGIHLAVDDFGTGYSSLGYLRTFPIRSLKIDRSFIRDIDRDPNGAAIAQAIIALASSLSLKAIAEGVETREQLDMLRGWGCEEMQGYYFCRPVPADELLSLLRQERRLPG